MGVEVEFVTMGIASKQLETKPQTLRLWTDQLEEYEVHYVMRNDNQERLYYDNDLEIFDYIKKVKDEFGRTTTTKNIAYTIQELAINEGKFKLRTREEVPYVEPTNTHLDLLNHKDIKKLLESDRVRQLFTVVLAENNKALKESIMNEFRGEFMEELREEVRESIRKEMGEGTDKLQDSIQKTNELIEESVQESRADRIKREVAATEESSRGFFARLFGTK